MNSHVNMSSHSTRCVTAHEQSIICSKTALQRNAHEQTIICRQLFAVPSANQNDGKNNMNDNILIIAADAIGK